MIDLNRANLSVASINVAVNDAIERAAMQAAELPRPYLGASIVGGECLRKVQYDWWCKPTHSARLREIFDRGHYFEERSRQLLSKAGFKFASPEVLAFSAVNGLLRGHADGIMIAGPNNLGAYLIYPLLWEHKAINARYWRALERDGWKRPFRNTPRKSRFIRLISTSPSGAVYGAKRRHLRAAASVGTVRHRTGAGLVRPRCHHHRGNARRRVAVTIHRRRRRLAL